MSTPVNWIFSIELTATGQDGHDRMSGNWETIFDSIATQFKWILHLLPLEPNKNFLFLLILLFHSPN